MDATQIVPVQLGSIEHPVRWSAATALKEALSATSASISDISCAVQTSAYLPGGPPSLAFADNKVSTKKSI
jgi:hypothetical protein